MLLLLLLGAGGFFAFRYVSGRGGTTATAGIKSEITPTQASLTPINTTFTYASVNITILNAQQATSFADDTGTSPQGVVRLNLHAVQSDVGNVYFASAPAFAYPECFTLLLSGGNNVSIASGGYKDLTGPVRKGDQTTWIDFPASIGLKVNQMILQIGKDTEEQIQVPLTGYANLSQYQPKQSTPNLRVQFGSVFWTLKTVTLKLSDSGTQADKGIRFLILSFSLDNPSTEADNSSADDYIRLQYGETTITLDQAVIGNAAASTANVSGVGFLPGAPGDHYGNVHATARAPHSWRNQPSHHPVSDTVVGCASRLIGLLSQGGMRYSPRDSLGGDDPYDGIVAPMRGKPEQTSLRFF